MVGNASIERRIAFDPATGLSTLSWLHKVTGTDFTKPAAAPRRIWRRIQFHAGGNRFTGKSGFELAGTGNSHALDGGKALDSA